VFNRKWTIYDPKGSVDDSQVMASRVSERAQSRTIPAALMGSAEVEGPVPNTVYVDKGAEFVAEGDEIDLTPDGLEYYSKNADKRKEIADEAQADVGESDFKPGIREFESSLDDGTKSR